MKKNVEFLGEVINCLSGLEIKQIEKSRKSFAEYFNNEYLGKTLNIEIIKDSISRIENIKPNCVYEVIAILNIIYIIFTDSEDKYLFILGPVIEDRISKENAINVLQKSEFTPDQITKILNIYSSLPLINYATINQLSAILIKELGNGNEKIEHKRVEYRLDLKKSKFINVDKRASELSQMRKIEVRYELNSELTAAVVEGNLSLALKILKQYNNISDHTVRNNNPLRNMQNYCIVLNTQLRHALEKTGIHPYNLDFLSNKIGLQIEKLKTVEEVTGFVIEVIREYCHLVQENKYPKLPSLVKLAVTYIKDNLSENITVKETAKFLNVNKDYLSNVFHKYMGITFIDFLNNERLQQAASLLSQTELQIQQVSFAVGFNNVSYFSKLFFRKYNKSPRMYRKEGNI